jgi:ATP-dependent RNA helicase DeaD
LAEKFESLGLNSKLVQGLHEIGFHETFPIQAEAISPLLEGKDLIGQAKTGSGKTLAYALPMLESIHPNSRSIQGLVLVPTRELAVQVAGEFERVSRHLPIRTIPLYGGASINVQIDKLHEGPVKIIVATPGRLLDHIERRTVRLDATRFVVIDEADRMLDMGFIDDVKRILDELPREHQTALFSATMPDEVVRLSHRYLSNPLHVFVDSDEIAVETLRQSFVMAEEDAKFSILLAILKREKMDGGLIFCSTRIRAAMLATALSKKGVNAEALHGDMTQYQRDQVSQAFRRGKIDVLVATDVAARGLDIPWVSHVVNYDMPEDPLMYFHRVGRTARAGEKGTSISLVSHQDQEVLRRIRDMTETAIREDPSLEIREVSRVHLTLPSRPILFGGSGRRKAKRDNRGRRHTRSFRHRRRR